MSKNSTNAPVFTVQLVRDLSMGQALPSELFQKVRVIGFEKSRLFMEFPDEMAKLKNRFHFDLIFHTPGTGEKLIFQTNAKIESIEPAMHKPSDSNFKLVSLSLSQYNENRWKEICSFCETRQQKVTKLFKKLKG